MRDSIFVSYSHADRAFLDELKATLGELPPETQFETWEDSRITPSAQWQKEIDEALQTAAAAVLFLSSHFFASQYIARFELPPLLAAAQRGELRLLPVVLENCAHQSVTETFQAVNDPAQPLVGLDETARQKVWRRLADELHNISASIGRETKVGAELIRLKNDLAARADIIAIGDKVARISTDPNLDDWHRENELCQLEGERCQAMAAALMEEMQRTDLTPLRSTAVVQELKSVAAAEEKALARFKELTQELAEGTLEKLRREKKN